MAHRIQLLPSGREFAAEEGESLLDAALRAGLAVGYQCSSGTCGECKGRLVSGEHALAAPFDYRFSEAERQQGYFLLCMSQARSDMVIEARLASDGETIPHQRIETRLAKVEHPGDEQLIFHLRTPRRQSLRFLAGQSVRLSAAGLSERLAAVASCPCNGRELQFHLQRSDARDWYERLTLEPPPAVVIEGPFGQCTLDPESRRPLVFLALDSGFAAAKSLIEQAIALDEPRTMQLLWFASSPGGHYLENQCRAWQDCVDGFSYRLLSAPALAGEEPEAVVESLAGQSLAGPADADVYLALPAEVAAAVKMKLRRALPDARLFDCTPQA